MVHSSFGTNIFLFILLYMVLLVLKLECTLFTNNLRKGLHLFFFFEDSEKAYSPRPELLYQKRLFVSKCFASYLPYSDIELLCQLSHGIVGYHVGVSLF